MNVPFQYRVVPDGKLFAVVCIHQESPDWWHVVARFADQDRAERYAEVEGDCVADNFAADPVWEGDERPAPVAELPAPPPTKVTPENFRPPSPAEKARVGAALIGDAARETGARAEVRVVETPRNASQTQVLEPPVEGPPLRDTPKLKAPIAVTGNAEKVWRAITAIRDEGREPLTGEIVERAGIPKGSLGAAKDTLYTRGVIDCDDTGIIVLRRPDDMPAPDAPPKPRSPALDTQPQVFTRTASAPARAATAPLEPVEVGVRDVIRYLAKDIGLVVRGPDDEQSYVVDNRKGLQGPSLVELANKWRERRKEPPFQLAEAEGVA